MCYLGTPIVGDRLYGAQKDGDVRLCLHAAELEITIPGSKRSIFSAPLPDDFNTIIDNYRTS
ncbi:hypothetical protein CYG49_00595 [Candidatus Saccharibacteria bacterium]|nr:MAG: hypothetical protein CYG49_00595 [Candidatus Saccharibacteria bacterium]